MNWRHTKAAESPDANSNAETEQADTEGCNYGLNPIELPYLWYPNQESTNHLEYVRRLECEFTCLQRAFLALTTQFARLQFRVRQIVQAHPCEREALLLDLEHMAFNAEDNDELPPIQADAANMGDVRRKQNFIIERLREQLCTLAEAQSWTPIPDLDAEPPAPDSVNEVTCFCIKKKRKPPPMPAKAPSMDKTGGGAMSSGGSTHSATSKSKAETSGMESESPSEYNKSKSSLKQRVSIGEEALGMGRNPDAAFSVTTSTVCFELCEGKLTPAAAAAAAPARKSARPCECKAVKRRQNSNNNCEPKC